MTVGGTVGVAVGVTVRMAVGAIVAMKSIRHAHRQTSEIHIFEEQIQDTRHDKQRAFQAYEREMQSNPT